MSFILYSIVLVNGPILLVSGAFPLYWIGSAPTDTASYPLGTLSHRFHLLDQMTLHSQLSFIDKALNHRTAVAEGRILCTSMWSLRCLSLKVILTNLPSSFKVVSLIISGVENKSSSESSCIAPGLFNWLIFASSSL